MTRDTRWLPNDIWAFDDPNKTPNPKLQLNSSWAFKASDLYGTTFYVGDHHTVTEELVSGSSDVYQVVVRPDSLQENILMSLKKDGGTESTLVLSLSKKTGPIGDQYSSYVDISFNRLADPTVPKFVQYLRGTGSMPCPLWIIQSKKDEGGYVTHAKLDPVTKIWELGDNAGISSEGGWMEKFYYNITTPAKGQVVRPSTGSDDTVSLSPVGTTATPSVDPFGVVYDGIPDLNNRIWVVTGGKAEVLYVGSTTRRQFARICVDTDTGAAAGQAIAEALPTSPFATDKHFMEIGHLLQSRTGAGLALTALHFN
jgi:hypothetical protein